MGSSSAASASMVVGEREGQGRRSGAGGGEKRGNKCGQVCGQVTMVRWPWREWEMAVAVIRSRGEGMASEVSSAGRQTRRRWVAEAVW